MTQAKTTLFATLAVTWTIIAFAADGNAKTHWQEARIPGTSAEAVTLGRHLDGDGDPDEVDIRLEIIEVQEEVYPGEFTTFWVFAPEGQGMASGARSPLPDHPG